MGRFSLSAVGADQPGIVAAVTGVLAEHGGNLQDSTMAVLQGQFAIVLIVSMPEPMEAAAIEAALAPVAEAFDLVVAVRDLHERPAAGPGPEALTSWSIAVHGADRPGLVHAVTTALAEAGGNIVDLATHLVGDPAQPVYTLTLRATVPAAAATAAADRVEEAARRLGMGCTIRPDDADVL